MKLRGKVMRLASEAIAAIDTCSIDGDTCAEGRDMRRHLTLVLEHGEALERRLQAQDGEGSDD